MRDTNPTVSIEDERAILAVVGKRIEWAAMIATRLDRKHVRVCHLESTSNLDHWLFSKLPICIFIADDAAPLKQLVDTVFRWRDRDSALVVIADHSRRQETGWLLREAGAHLVVGNVNDLMAALPSILRFFSQQHQIA